MRRFWNFFGVDFAAISAGQRFFARIAAGRFFYNLFRIFVRKLWNHILCLKYGMTYAAMAARRFSFFFTGRVFGRIFYFGMAARFGNGCLRFDHGTADPAVNSFRFAVCSAGRRLGRVRHFRMCGFWNLFLRFHYGIADAASLP